MRIQKISSRKLLENMSEDMGVIKTLVIGMKITLDEHTEMLRAHSEVLGNVAVDVEQLKIDMKEVKKDVKKLDKRLEFVENR